MLAAIGVGLATWRLLTVETLPHHPPALGFDLPSDRQLAALAADLFGVHGRLGARDEFRAASSIDVTVLTHGCNPWVDVEMRAYLDSRWWLAYKATMEHRALRVPLAAGMSFVGREPQVTGEFAFAVTGDVRNLVAVTRGQTVPVAMKIDAERSLPGFNVYRGAVPRAALRKSLISEYIAPSVDLRFAARWVHRRSYGTCWVTMPQLTGSVAALAALGAVDGMTGNTSFELGPLDGRTTLITSAASAMRDVSEPSPRYSVNPVWTCSSKRQTGNAFADHQNCSAAVGIQRDGFDRRAQALLLLLSGLLSAAVVGFFAGVRRLVVGA